MAQNVLGTATERAQRRNPDVEVSATILPDDPVSVLLEAGDSAFALVTGSRGRGELKGLLLGSVSLAVAARARCPVVVVRGDAAGPAGSHERIRRPTAPSACSCRATWSSAPTATASPYRPSIRRPRWL